MAAMAGAQADPDRPQWPGRRRHRPRRAQAPGPAARGARQRHRGLDRSSLRPQGGGFSNPSPRARWSGSAASMSQPTLADVHADYELLDADDRYRLLIDLGRALEPMPDAL